MRRGDVADNRFGITYEIRNLEGEWMDISPLVDSRETTITRNVCTEEFKSAIDTASFLLRPVPALLQMRAAVVSLLLAAAGIADAKIYVRVRKDSEPLFYGTIDLDSVDIQTLKTPQDITLTCEDASASLLDVVPQQYIVLENARISVIVERVLEAAGCQIGDMKLKDEDDVVKRAFIVNPDEGDTWRSYIDTLLFEAGGYVLDCDESGVMSIRRIPLGDETIGARLVENYLVADGISSETTILKEDGVKLKWSTLAETEPDEPQTIFVDDIERSIDDDGNYVGYGMAPGEVWPENGDTELTYQEYEADFLDREYQSKQKKNANKDLSLVLVKNVEASITVWDEGHNQIEPDDAFEYPLPSDFDMQSNPTLFPTKAWYLLKNKTARNLNLTSFSLQGDCIYRNRINTLLVPETSSNPEEYESIYIYTIEEAKKFAAFYHQFKLYSRTKHQWSELGDVELGSIVKIHHKTTEIAQAAFIVQVETTFVGVYRKSTCIAVSIGPYDEYSMKEWGDNNGPSSEVVAVYSTTDFYLSSDEYQGITVDTPGWSTKSDYGDSDTGKYLWSYKRTQYTNGKVVSSVPTVIAVKGDSKGITSISTEYALSNSSTTAPADGWSTSIPQKAVDQYVWQRTKINYTDETFEYTDVHVQYNELMQFAWGRSATEEPFSGLWLREGRFFIWKHNFIRDDADVWSYERPPRPDGIWYLWVRWSYDNGASWINATCIQGDVARDFSINAPDSYSAERNTVLIEQHLSFSINRINGMSGQCVWAIDAAALNGGVLFSNGEATAVGDSAVVVVPVGFNLLSFSVSAQIGDIVRTRELLSVSPNPKREYLGVYYDSARPENAHGKPFMTGDSITVVDTKNKTSDIYCYVEDVGWVNDLSRPELSKDAYSIVMDSFYDMTAQAAQNNQPLENGAAWAMFRNIVAVNAFFQNFWAGYARIEGAIYGGGFDSAGNNTTGTAGFHLSKNGDLQAVMARFKQISVEGLNAVNAVISGELNSNILKTSVEIPIDVSEPLVQSAFLQFYKYYSTPPLLSSLSMVSGSFNTSYMSGEIFYVENRPVNQSTDGFEVYRNQPNGSAVIEWLNSSGALVSSRLSSLLSGKVFVKVAVSHALNGGLLWCSDGSHDYVFGQNESKQLINSNSETVIDIAANQTYRVIFVKDSSGNERLYVQKKGNDLNQTIPTYANPLQKGKYDRLLLMDTYASDLSGSSKGNLCYICLYNAATGDIAVTKDLKTWIESNFGNHSGVEFSPFCIDGKLIVPGNGKLVPFSAVEGVIYPISTDISMTTISRTCFMDAEGVIWYCLRNTDGELISISRPSFDGRSFYLSRTAIPRGLKYVPRGGVDGYWFFFDSSLNQIIAISQDEFTSGNYGVHNTGISKDYSMTLFHIGTTYYMFVNEKYFYSSDNLDDWKATSMNESIQYQSVIYCNGFFYGKDNSNSSSYPGRYFKSQDGITWASVLELDYGAVGYKEKWRLANSKIINCNGVVVIIDPLGIYVEQKDGTFEKASVDFAYTDDTKFMLGAVSGKEIGEVFIATADGVIYKTVSDFSSFESVAVFDADTKLFSSTSVRMTYDEKGFIYMEGGGVYAASLTASTPFTCSLSGNYDRVLLLDYSDAVLIDSANRKGVAVYTLVSDYNNDLEPPLKDLNVAETAIGHVVYEFHRKDLGNGLNPGNTSYDCITESGFARFGKYFNNTLWNFLNLFGQCLITNINADILRTPVDTQATVDDLSVSNLIVSDSKIAVNSLGSILKFDYYNQASSLAIRDITVAKGKSAYGAVASLMPMAGAFLGSPLYPFSNIYSEKFEGNVNSEGTSNTVWGAVAN